jgi:hypothetical protein
MRPMHLADYCKALGDDSSIDHPQSAYHKALARYLFMARFDVAAGESDLTLDDLKGMPPQQEDVTPGQSSSVADIDPE